MNLSAEFLTITLDRKNIEIRRNPQNTNFGPTNGHKVDRVTDYFFNMGEEEFVRIGDEFKIGFVGMRGPDKYDQNGIWGLEYRNIRSDHAPERVKMVLDAVQSQMREKKYGVEPVRMGSWLNLDENKNLIVSYNIGKLYYGSSWKGVFKRLPPYIEKQFHPDVLKMMRKRLLRLGDNFTESKMLYHNWINDPLVYDNPELITKIQEFQIEALKSLENKVVNNKGITGKFINEIVSNFLTKSGLQEEVFRSVNLHGHI